MSLLFGAAAKAMRFALAGLLAVWLYAGAEALGRRAEVVLPGQSFDVALPALVVAVLLGLVIFPLFGGWRGGLRDFAVMTAITLLAIAAARGVGVLRVDPVHLLQAISPRIPPAT